ncbi:glutathione S-transferase 1-1-like [Athalia rosae]|uniref:glutathione S-transferase 1-1-like n=1 Tax=Athalia rosae TaxID=37344 RepID=UPI0020336AF9|nr:glutathione S-transferase 1-1-like [Athalia rosae]
MALNLYYTQVSPPCRAVMLTAEAIGMKLNLINVDIFSGENLKPEYEQLNPQKTIPLLIDGEYKIWESKAIMIYLVNKYGQSAERLYPKNPAARAVVNQRLYFDTIYLDKRIREYYFPSAFMGESIMDPVKYENLCFGFELLNKYLENQNYVCGRILTLADLSIVTSVSTAEVFDFDLAKYKNVTEWYERVKSSAPGYKLANAEGAEMMKQLLENLKSQKSDEQ